LGIAGVPFRTVAGGAGQNYKDKVGRHRSPLAGIVVALMIGATLAAGCAGTDQEPALVRALGSEPLVARTPEQFDVDLAGLRGRVVVVNFWASWCGPCRAEMPLLQRMSQAYADKPVTFVGVDASDGRPAAEAFLRQVGVGFPTVFDPKGVQSGIASRWSVTGLPQTWFLARDGSRSSRWASAIPEAELRARIDQLLGP
jgi:cytochrome c biogenesis protein CcmG, thiol:disulfide interchange protein DsbE